MSSGVRCKIIQIHFSQPQTLSSVTSSAIYLLYCPRFKELRLSGEFKRDNASRHRVLDILGRAKESALESLHFKCYEEVGPGHKLQSLYGRYRI